jgi:F0F1-type ATP synthase assembly protein I
MSPSPKPRQNQDPVVFLARYSEIGFIIPAAVLLGFFLGKLLDYWLHTKWLYLIGLLFGAVVGFSQMIRMALSASGQNSDGDSASESGPASDHPASNHPAPKMKDEDE